MDWLEQNLDGYRIVSEILGQLREAVREALEQSYGEKWYRKGLPQEVFDRLVAAKEHEKSIDWYEEEYQQLMAYLTFPDLVEILQKNAGLFPELMALAPSESLLNARFLELDVMRAKLGRARPISETELSFLGTFHVRFQKAIGEMRKNPRPKVSAPAAPVESDHEPIEAKPREATFFEQDTPADGEVFVDDDSHRKIPSVQTEQPPTTPETHDEPSRPIRPVQSSVGSGVPAAGGAEEIDEGDDDLEIEIQTPEETASPDDRVDQADQQPFQDEISSGLIARPDRAANPVSPRKLQEAMSTNDHLTVLREIYREVTAIAESVWSSEGGRRATVWEQVTSSDWYEVNFSRLGLEPLSTFYDVTDKVQMKIKLGADRAELQEFLKEANFAKTLLALRDMFQANKL